MKCPNCGAAVHDDGFSTSVTCPYCSAEVQFAREPRKDGRHPLQDERDELASRIAQQERDWNARIAALEQSGFSQHVGPAIIGLALAGLLFAIGAGVGASKGIDPDKGLGPMLGGSFYLIVFLVPYITYKVRKRSRAKQAGMLASERELALEPERKRLQRLDKRIAGVDEQDPRVRLRELEAERQQISQYMDKVLAHVENVRNGGSSDLTMAPLLGCVPAGAMFIIVSLYLRFDENSIFWLFGTWVLGTIVMWIARVIRRSRRLAVLTEARDAVIPDCQKQLDRIEAEIARL